MGLLTLGNIGVILFSRISMGGNDMPLFAAILFLIVATTSSMYLAWYNIRRHQVEEHRKWMLRAMFWMSIIITQRLILPIFIAVTSYIGGFYTVSVCRIPSTITTLMSTCSFGRVNKSIPSPVIPQLSLKNFHHVYRTWMDMSPLWPI